MIALCATSVFAFKLNLSAGAEFDYSCQMTHAKYSLTAGIGKLSTTTTTNRLEYFHLLGGSIFADSDYLRLSFGCDFSVGGKKGNMKVKALGKETNTASENSDLVNGNLNLSILGKYPFKLGSIKAYPLAGFDFTFNVLSEDGGTDIRVNMSDDKKKDLNHYYFVAGFGADFKIMKNLYLSPITTFAIDLKKPSYYENMKKTNDKYTNNTFKVNARVAIGYKF